MQTYAVQPVQCPNHISEINAELLRGTEFYILLSILEWYNSLLKDGRGALQHLCIVFNCFQQHNLKSKSIKYKFFWNENNYLTHYVSKGGVMPSKDNLRTMAQFALPQTYMELWAFLSLVKHYQWFAKGFACIAQPIHVHLSGEGTSKKRESK